MDRGVPKGTGAPPLPFASAIADISEDCLSLGITRPVGAAASARLPVIVWMHGGGHALGSYADQTYDPIHLVEQSAEDGQPIMFVGINYRLGIFGFARSKALDEAGHTNAGLKDQRAAFEWVHDNIAAFGGDPENVILMGQSVGASDTGIHIISYGGAKGVPFQKAVMMSGAPGLTFNIDGGLVYSNTASSTEALGCSVSGDSQSEASLRCLQNVPMERLMNVSVSAARKARPPFGEAYFHPTLDGDYLPERPSKLLRQGKFVKGIQILASWVTNDGAWYASPATRTDEEVTASFGLWLSNLSNQTLTKLLELYPQEDFEWMARSEKIGGLSTQYYRAAQMNRDLWFTCPTLDFAHHYAYWSSSANDSSLYLYEHNATRFAPIYSDIMGVPFWRVAHLSDILYMLNNDVAAGGINEGLARVLSRKMSRSLVQFAYTGNPGMEWPLAFRPDELEQSKEGRLGQSDLPSKIRMMLFEDQREDSLSTPLVLHRHSHDDDVLLGMKHHEQDLAVG